MEDALNKARLLREKVQEAQAQKTLDVGIRISQRERLIEEQRTLTRSLTEAREIFDYLSSMKEAGEIRGEDLKQFEGVETMIASLVEQQREINAKIDLISKTPEVGDRLIETADAEGERRDAYKVIDDFNAEILKETKSIAEELIIAEGRLKEYFRLKQEIASKMSEVNYRTEITDFSGIQNRELRQELEELGNKLIRHELSADDFLKRLSDEQKSLGLFRGADKKEIGRLLLLYSGEVREYEELYKALRSTEADIRKPFDDSLVMRYLEIKRREYEIREWKDGAKKKKGENFFSQGPRIEAPDTLIFNALREFSGARNLYNEEFMSEVRRVEKRPRQNT